MGFYVQKFNQGLGFRGIIYLEGSFFLDNFKQLLSITSSRPGPSSYVSAPIFTTDILVTPPSQDGIQAGSLWYDFVVIFRCVYYDASEQQWTSGNDVCSVENNLANQLDDYVRCSCKHMSHYSVISTVSDPDVVGYNIWFYIACFICMVSTPSYYSSI